MTNPETGVEEKFDSTTVATAIADRLVNNSEVIIFEGPSYRTRSKAKKVDD